MRELILIGAAAAALSGCGGEQTAEERAAAERNVTSEVVQTNDTTAIDAATGQDANMAADVPFIPDIENVAGSNEAAPAAAPRRSATSSPRPRSPAPRPAEPESSDEDQPDSNGV
jgi:hypothetical protein